MKVKRLLVMFMLMSVCLLGVGCTSKTTAINEVITRYVNYDENITIYDIEDALVLASEKAQDSVIGIEAFSGSYVKTESLGSGVIIKRELVGSNFVYYAVTNYHVVEVGNRVSTDIQIYLGKYNDKVTGATCVVSNKNKDYAIVKFQTYRMLSVATIGDSAGLKTGRFAIAVGSPYEIKEFYNTVTIGNISSPLRAILEEGVTNYYIQHNAAINAGNSGGGLFNINGELIGINTWKISDVEIEGMGFAIPIHIIKTDHPSYFIN